MTDDAREIPEDLQWKSLAAPGLDEDDIFAAILGLPGTGAFWGDGRPSPYAPPQPEWSEEEDRRRRRDEILRKWDPQPE